MISIIGNYQNLTWSGNPINTVTLNGTDNTVGTARTYELDGAHLIETITYYSKPPSPGPYQEVHNTALLTIAAANLTAYIPYDGTVVTSVCEGKASMFNFTAHFCANNATVAGPTLTMLHTSDAMTVGKFLGGMNYTNCAALGASMSSGPANATAPYTPSSTMSGMPSGTASPSSTPSSSSGSTRWNIELGFISAALGVAGLVVM